MIISCSFGQGSSSLEENLESCTNKLGFANLLKHCAKLKDLETGKRLHSSIVAAGFAGDRILCNLLVQMYSRCGSLREARALFDRSSSRNVYSWNIMLSGYEQNGCGSRALKLFREMDLDGIRPDNVTYVSFLAACSALGDVAQGRAAHSRIVATGYLDVDVSVGNCLVNLYGKCGLVREAEAVFETMQLRNLVTWNTMIGAFARNGHSMKALELYKRMKVANVEVSYVTYVVVLGACSTLAQGREVHSDIVAARCKLVHATLENALIGFYAKFGSLDDARSIFDGMQHRKNIVSWNSMISAYAQNGNSALAIQTFRTMELQPDRVSFIAVLGACCDGGCLAEGRRIHELAQAGGFDKHLSVANALIHMYGQCGSPVDAKNVFERMQSRDIVSWNALINALAQNGDAEGALSLYHKLERESLPDAITFVSVLGACASCGDLKQGEEIHRRIDSSGLKEDVVVATATVTMFGKLGKLEAAMQVFGAMRKRTVVSWNAMIKACCQNGDSAQALQLFHRMDVKPDQVTYLSVIDAVASLRALQQGRLLHEQAASDGVLPQSTSLGNALIRMYGRCQCLEAARSLFNAMQTKTLVSWNSLIAACVENGENREALEIFKQMEELQPDNITYTSVLSACSNAGDLTEGRSIHSRLSDEADLELSQTVETSLISMYGNCGSLADAEAVFEAIRGKDATCWTSMIVGYAQNGEGSTGASLFYRMNLEGVEADKVTFSVLFFCCSHAGLLERGWEYFIIMVGDFGLEATEEHYVCMVDLLGRLGWLEDAERLVEGIPFPKSSVAWLTLLSACKVQRNLQRGSTAAERLMICKQQQGSNAAERFMILPQQQQQQQQQQEEEEADSAPYALLSGILYSGV